MSEVRHCSLRPSCQNSSVTKRMALATMLPMVRYHCHDSLAILWTTSRTGGLVVNASSCLENLESRLSTFSEMYYFASSTVSRLLMEHLSILYRILFKMPHGSEIVLSRLLMLESIVALTSLPTRSTSSTVVRHTRHYIIRKCRGCKLDILKYLLETWTVTLAHLIGKRAVFLTVCVKPLLDKFLKLLVLYSAGLYLHQKSL